MYPFLPSLPSSDTYLSDSYENLAMKRSYNNMV
jgi:hypothetical protein